jgi:hypothetical protein
MDDNFKFIVDPETNKSVPINSVIGTQIVKNYLECIKNGPDSKKIVSTKRFYKKKSSPPVPKFNGSDKSSSTNKTTSASASSTNPTQAKEKSKSLYSKAQELSCDQIDRDSIQRNKNSSKLRIGSLCWIKRSSGKWQKAIVYEAYKQKGHYYLNIYLNAGGGNVGSKKDVPLKDIILV